MHPRILLQAVGLAAACTLPTALAHDPATPHTHAEVTAIPLSFITEARGPVAAPKAAPLAPGAKITGQGFWKFTAARNKMPVPPEALPKLKGAHGTLVVDPSTDTVYWGLQDIGWIGFTERLSKSSVVAQDPAFKSGNLHGADLLPRRGQAPLVVAADNVHGRVFLSDTSFQQPQVLKTPNLEPYADGKGYAPTDAAFEGKGRIWVTDGYGKAWFMPAGVAPFAFLGEAHGGKSFSGTPHGITYDPKTQSLLLSARPEGLIKTWNPKKKALVSIDGLPPGSTVCDVDVWGDYALAPCLDGAAQSPGPIYIVNLKKKAVVATLKPKLDLGYEDAQHIHDACWYVTGKGRDREVYVLYTNWNPGGVGALKLVQVAD
jgi:hypothetical protein